MGKGLFVTGTGTDVGKTYVTALMVKKLKDAGLSSGYYKAAISGAGSIGESDAGYVKKYRESISRMRCLFLICMKRQCLLIWRRS